MSEKKTIEEVRDTGFGRGFVLLSDTYINNKTKLEWGCKNNHIFFSRFNDIVSGYGCPEFKCSGKRKISIEHCKKVAKRKGGLCLSEKYVNYFTKLKWKCSCGNVWKTVLCVVENGHWCPACGNNSKREKTCLEKYGVRHPMQSKEIKDKTKKTNLNKYGVEYVSQNKDIMLKQSKSANNSHVLKHWKTKENIICRGGYEKAVVEHFNKNKIDFKWQISFDMPDGKKYFIDAYIPEKDLYIEIKGWIDRNLKTKNKWFWFHDKYPNSELWNKKALREMGIL